MAIVLASQYPRRQELLARIGVEDFKTLSLDIDESYPEGLSPEDTVRYIAKKKCDAAAALCSPDDLIITADTMVFLGNDRRGKPRDEEDALRMLRETNILSQKEIGGAKAVLDAAALTYVAALVMTVLQLVRLIALSGLRRDE